VHKNGERQNDARSGQPADAVRLISKIVPVAERAFRILVYCGLDVLDAHISECFERRGSYGRAEAEHRPGGSPKTKERKVAAEQKEMLLPIEGKNIAAKKAAKPDRATDKKEDWLAALLRNCRPAACDRAAIRRLPA
jgi:hypothetical protein